MRLLPGILTLILADVWAQNLEKSRSVWVEQGLVRGKIYKLGEQQVQIFRGIPYAEPPIGDLRYKMPMRKQRWEKEFAAVDYGPPCVQFMDFHKNDRFSGPNMPHESEDCLYLNIFSPYDSEDESKLYPIIVWIHGGSFLAGSADTGIDMEAVAKNLVFKGITLVTINYRLGPFGFMSIDYGDHIEGNFGIYDQKLALEWIQRNIKQFNGDPSSVSVMGESAGAAAISVLGLSPLTRGLIHQVIALSGSATAGWSIQRHGMNAWDMNNIADYIRCNKIIPEQDLKAVLNRESVNTKGKTTEHCNLQLHVPECLLNTGKMNPKDMLECFRKEVNFSEPLFRHALSAELGVSKMVVDGQLIPASGIELVSDYAHLPLLTGVASREWAHKRPEFYEFWRYENMSRSKAEEAVKKLVYTSYASRLPGKVPNATLNLISNATFLRYMQDVDFNFDMPGVVARLQDLEADIEFVAPCQSEVDSYAKNGLDVFVYSFDYIPKGNIVEVDKRFYELFGDNQVTVTKKDASSDGYEITAFHGLDHAFIFSHGYSSNFQIKPFTKQDRAMSKLLTTMITNFAKTGDPSIEVFEWPAYTNSSAHYVSIGLHPKLIRGQLHFPAPEFWNHEAAMLAKYTLSESPLSDEEVSELTVEERKQLNAYRRAWWALWLFVIAVAIIIWVAIICFVIKKGKSPTSKPYDNIVVNRE